MTEDDRPTRPRGIEALEGLIEDACATARESLRLARSIDRSKDDFGQDIAFKRALELMDRTARVGMALGKFEGRHASTIKVHRVESPTGPGPAKLAEARSKLAMEAARRAGDEEFWERWRKTFEDEQDRLEAAAADAEARGEGDPPPGPEGSNASSP